MSLRKKAWKVAPLCLFWSIWRKRNRRTFENCECSNHSFKSSFLYLSGDQVRQYIGVGSLSTLDFVDWLGAPQGADVFVTAPFCFWFLVYIVYTFLFNTIVFTYQIYIYIYIYNLLTLNLFLFSFTLYFLPLFISIFFPQIFWESNIAYMYIYME